MPCPNALRSNLKMTQDTLPEPTTGNSKHSKATLIIAKSPLRNRKGIETDKVNHTMAISPASLIKFSLRIMHKDVGQHAIGCRRDRQSYAHSPFQFHNRNQIERTLFCPRKPVQHAASNFFTLDGASLHRPALQIAAEFAWPVFLGAGHENLPARFARGFEQRQKSAAPFQIQFPHHVINQ